MSRDINEQALNEVTVCGKLSDVTFNNGKLSDGRAWESAVADILVTENVNGVDEQSIISVKVFATPLTSTGKQHPGWQTIQELKNMNTIQNVGLDAAQRVGVRKGEIRENSFVARSGQVVTGWALNTTFVNKITNGADKARARLMVFIMDMHDEVNSEGDETGRLIIKGGVVGYGGKLNVMEFVVEDPDYVENARRTLEVNNTVVLNVRLRVLAREETYTSGGEGWGEEIVETTTRTVRELVVVGANPPLDEEFAYSPDDIHRAFNERKAEIEQMQLEAKNRSAKGKAKTATPGPATTPADNKYSWE